MNKSFLVLEHLKFSCANSVAGLTYGFPSVGAILGFIENINIFLKKKDSVPFTLSRVVILSHSCSSRVFRENRYKDYSFIQKRAPLAKDGKTAPIIQEGYMDGDISLIIELLDNNMFYDDDFLEFKQELLSYVYTLRFASGNIDKINDCAIVSGNKVAPRIKSLYPFSALVNKSYYLTLISEKNPTLSKIDILMSLSSIHYLWNSEEKFWEQRFANDGYIVPLHVGYKAISRDFNEKEKSQLRSDKYEACFVEPVFSAAEWICSPRKLLELLQKDYESASWHYYCKDNYYLFSNKII